MTEAMPMYRTKMLVEIEVDHWMDHKHGMSIITYSLCHAGITALSSKG